MNKTFFVCEKAQIYVQQQKTKSGIKIVYIRARSIFKRKPKLYPPPIIYLGVSGCTMLKIARRVEQHG